MKHRNECMLGWSWACSSNYCLACISCSPILGTAREICGLQTVSSLRLVFSNTLSPLGYPCCSHARKKSIQHGIPVIIYFYLSPIRCVAPIPCGFLSLVTPYLSQYSIKRCLQPRLVSMIPSHFLCLNSFCSRQLLS